MSVLLDEPRVVKIPDPELEVALYRRDEPGRPPSVEEQVAKLEEMGLAAQARRVRREANLKFAKQFFAPLLGRDFRVWRTYLPTPYIEAQRTEFDERRGRRDHAKFLSDYYFDTVPPVVIDEITMVRSLGVFDWLEIWSPEVPQRPARADPMVVGVIPLVPWRFFAVTRWAESLISTAKAEEIVRELYGVRKKHCGERMIRIPGDWEKLCLVCGSG